MYKLQALTLPVSALTAAQLVQMYRLMETHYEAVDYERFEADLVKKDRVILVRDPEETIHGFTTLMRCRPKHPTTHTTVQVLYSGDTIIDRRHWGSQALAFEWIYQAGREKARHPQEPLFWFLISKGPRTYRYLSVFSRSYWPHYAVQTPEKVSGLMHALATQRFGANYYPAQGVVHFPTSHGHLRRELAEVDAADRRRPEVEFFLQANPGYARGDELVCLTELASANLKPLSRRIFEKGLQEVLAQSDAPCLETIT
jgi:hypothetical protein